MGDMAKASRLKPPTITQRINNLDLQVSDLDGDMVSMLLGCCRLVSAGDIEIVESWLDRRVLLIEQIAYYLATKRLPHNG